MNYVEVKYLPEKSKAYLGSPSILRLADGSLLAVHDYFGAEGILDTDHECMLTSVYKSYDDGATWQNVTHIPYCFWCNLLEHNGEVYLLSCSKEYGDILLRKTTDGGYTWSVPCDEKHGLLFRAGERLAADDPRLTARSTGNWDFMVRTRRLNPNPHLPVTPWVHAYGRVFKTVEFYDTTMPIKGFYPKAYSACVMSAPEDADLMDASNWTFSNKLPFMEDKFPAEIIREGTGFLEQTLAVAPDGSLKGLIRVHFKTFNNAVMLNLSKDGRELTYDPQPLIENFPGGQSKFSIRRDEKTGLYVTLTNPRTFWDNMDLSQRNVLTLNCSADLRNWRELCVVCSDESGLPPELSCRLTGFQYPDWQFDGDNIIALVRTAYRGANRFHDANRITYHVIKNFRSLI